MADLLGKLLVKESSVGSLVFDLNLGEQHNLTSDITEHSVEDGSQISDHIRNQLRVGTLTGFISNWSINSKINPQAKDRMMEAYGALKKIWKEKKPITIVTFFETYIDVGITNIGIGSPDGGTAFRPQISFKEMNIVKLAKVVLDTDFKVGAMDNDTSKQSAQKADLGKQVGV